MITKPMLAGSCKDPKELKFPVLVTPKLDGIRCIKVGGKAVSRKFKPIPNHHIRNCIEQNCPDGFDGEIMIPGASFNEVQSKVMTEDGTPDFEYWVFDWVSGSLEQPYNLRMAALATWAKSNFPPFVRILLPTPVTTPEEFNSLEERFVKQGYEGIMVRSASSPYKCNRSTLKEGYLLKVKRFEDSEATIIGYEEKLHNANEATVNELGYTKRSSHKANLVPAGTLGTLLVKDIKTGIEFGLGTGFDDATRLEIWNNQEKFLGRILTYQYQGSGMLEKPRFPSFKGFRSTDDM